MQRFKGKKGSKINFIFEPFFIFKNSKTSEALPL